MSLSGTLPPSERKDFVNRCFESKQQIMSEKCQCCVTSRKFRRRDVTDVSFVKLVGDARQSHFPPTNNAGSLRHIEPDPDQIINQLRRSAVMAVLQVKAVFGSTTTYPRAVRVPQSYACSSAANEVKNETCITWLVFCSASKLRASSPTYQSESCYTHGA